MKAQSIFFQTFRCILAGAVCLFCSCSSDDPEVAPSTSSENGEVSFELVTSGSNGNGSASSPFEVTMGETFELSISQQSRYTDTDGTVFECEPAATIALSMQADTVYAENLQQLTATSEPKVESSSQGESPVRYGVTQEFPIGGQSVVFDLSYEVYDYTTASGKTIEMPYVKPDQAKLGSSSATESRGGAVVKSITVKPLPQSRTSVSDTTWYEVDAVFNLEVECMNAKTDNKQNLTFSVTYLGAVTTEIELGEPVGELSTTIEALGGTNSTSSPFIVNPKEEMSLLFRQNSSYIDAYGNKMVCEPQARINLFAQYDTLYVSTLEELEVTPASQDFVFTESGEDPVLYSTVQLFKLGIQMVQLDMSYETYTAMDVENNEITMPYLKQNATMPGAVTVNEISTATGEKADTTFYDVKFPITLETVDVGTPDENIQTIELVVSYIGAIVTWKDEPELVKVEYRTGYVWEEAHDNLPLLYYAHVFRDRYYSTGEVITDTFVDVGHMVGSFSSIQPEEDVTLEIENGECIVHHASTKTENDSVLITYCETEVPNLDLLSTEISDDRYTISPAGTWEDYFVSKLYQDAFLPVDGSFCQQSWENCDMPTGWYFKDTGYVRSIDVDYNGVSVWFDIRRYNLYLVYFDQYLSIDGKRIDFLEYLPKHSFNFTVEEQGRSRIYKFECTSKFMGRTFYVATIDTIHEQ